MHCQPHPRNLMKTESLATPYRSNQKRARGAVVIDIGKRINGRKKPRSASENMKRRSDAGEASLQRRRGVRANAVAEVGVGAAQDRAPARAAAGAEIRGRDRVSDILTHLRVVRNMIEQRNYQRRIISHQRLRSAPCKFSRASGRRRAAVRARRAPPACPGGIAPPRARIAGIHIEYSRRPLSVSRQESVLYVILLTSNTIAFRRGVVIIASAVYRTVPPQTITVRSRPPVRAVGVRGSRTGRQSVRSRVRGENERRSGESRWMDVSGNEISSDTGFTCRAPKPI